VCNPAQSIFAAAVATFILCATIASVVTRDMQSGDSVHNLMLAGRQASLGTLGREQTLYGENLSFGQRWANSLLSYLILPFRTPPPGSCQMKAWKTRPKSVSHTLNFIQFYSNFDPF
jgi:glycerol uptake facilitator-like aquaporin